MEAGFKLENENPIKSANILSKIFFTWMIKLFYKSIKKELEVSDIYITLDSDKSKKLGDKLEKCWKEELEKSKNKNSRPSLLKAISRTFLSHYMLYGYLLAIQYLLVKPAQPILLATLLSLFAQPSDENNQKAMYTYAGILIGTAFISVILLHHINFGQCSIGMRIRIALSSLIYRKMLRLNKMTLGKTAVGQVVNLLSNDVSRFDIVVYALHFLWLMPIQTVLITYLLWEKVGISSLVGVVSMVLLILPVQGYLGKLTFKLRFKVAQRTDYRVKLMSEIISGIQVIKMYAWEKPFEQVIKLARKNEINILTKTSYLRGIFLSFRDYVERTCLFLTLIYFALLGNIVAAEKVFSTSQFFNIMQYSMAIMYPMAITYGVESLVCIKRLQEFLILEEKGESGVENFKEMEINIEHVNASWAPCTPILHNINIHIPPGSLCAVIGPVGSGKSSLLQLLLAELQPESGSIKMGGKISYSSQESWLFASTIRNNILFGEKFDKLRYNSVVNVCALEKDFQQFPQGERTIVGDRGVSLSGGQKARINLARAVYRDAGIYLLDDPLSAVDTHVGNHLFEKCVCGYLRGTTRVLITHQLQYLKKADFIILLNEGKIEASGTFEELSKSNLHFTNLLVTANETNEKESLYFENSDRLMSNTSLRAVTLEKETDLVENEEMGASGASSFKDYIKSAGNVCVLITLSMIIILGQACCTGADFWVTFWTQQEAIRHSNQTEFPVEARMVTLPRFNHVKVYNDNSAYSFYSYVPVRELPKEQIKTFINDFLDKTTDHVIFRNVQTYIIKTDIAMYVYSAFIFTAIFVALIRSLLFFKVAMTASKNLHNKMFHSLLEAPMRFFYTNPTGRILNRFSKDMGSVDDILPRVLLESIQIMLVMSGILVTVAVTNIYSVIAIVVMGLVFLKIRTWYIKTAKSIKHIEGITKSPVFSHLNSSLNGITTIRACQAEDILISEFDNHQDVNTSAWYLILTCTYSFGLWLDIICAIFVGCVTFSFVVLNQYSIVSGSIVGLAISQSMILTGMLQYGIRQTAEVVNQLTSVDRVMQYTHLEKEGPFETPENKMPVLPWPSNGLIEFQHLYLRYLATNPPVLKNLNFTIKPGEKVGIVGRTGAGKSSLISALFKLTNLEGSIIIDGVDTKNLGLHDLRKKISIIPQEPVLFSATLRQNLDPFNEFKDSKLWKVLEEVELRDIANSLDFIVSEGGSNFSLGQRQLICLARAILRNNTILVLDEATANVDQRTDLLIQATIRRKFHKCTVLTIAHRLNTIMDSDKVLVMESGQIIEFGHPHILLQNPKGHFLKMVEQTGLSMTTQLKDIAMNAYHSKIKII